MSWIPEMIQERLVIVLAQHDRNGDALPDEVSQHDHQPLLNHFGNPRHVRLLRSRHRSA